MCMKVSYVCCLHFVSGNGPKEVDPDPISAVASKERVSYISFISLFCLWDKYIYIPCLGVATQS